MKKVLAFFLALSLSIGAFAQTPLTEAVDFSTTDHHGNEIHLFEILDGGQYVLIDFFYTSCGPCQGTIPHVVDAYYALGCNQHDVFFMEVSPTDHNDEPFYFIDTWIETYGIEYPTIYLSGTPDNGSAICDMYQIPAYPTMILISPDREIILQDIWPINSAQTIIDALAPFGIEEHSCDEAQTPAIVFDIEREASYAIDAKFTPNAVSASYYVLASTNAELDAETVKAEGQELTEGGLHTFTELTASTEYYIYGLPVGADGEFGELRSEPAKTKCEATAGEAALELNVAVVPGFVIADALPNSATSEYHYAFLKVEKFEEYGEEYAIFQLLRDGHPICGDDFWQLQTEYFEPGYDYYCFGIGYNADAELGQPTYVRFNLEEGVIDDNEAKVNIEVEVLTETSVRTIATPNMHAVEYHYNLFTIAEYEELGEEAITELLLNDGLPLNEVDDWTWEELAPKTDYYAIGVAVNADGEVGSLKKVPFRTEVESISEMPTCTFTVSPNPASSYVNIKSDSDIEAEVNIYDMTGRCVKSVVVSGMNATISVEDLNQGVYFMNVNGVVEKLVIE
ncbi:MAG: T9SS type A sorting domain-containing protein [Bacteroidales bacterium]|nr:T9SS type A sorting domain-containing protein [Bacteroidales bacterium]